jgi:hypothetical protein
VVHILLKLNDLMQYPMPINFGANRQVKLLWERLWFFSKSNHPASGLFKNKPQKERKEVRQVPRIQSPDSVHLRGAFNKDPQRKNPAP